MAIDPVCKMEVSEKDAPGKASFNGKDYYFCSKDCEKQFKANPQQYASSAA
jgi:YHS domain-containing protein